VTYLRIMGYRSVAYVYCYRLVLKAHIQFRTANLYKETSRGALRGVCLY
jgi:hypothetical protein